MLDAVKSYEGNKSGERNRPSPAPQVNIPGISSLHNDRLTAFFSGTVVRTRVYYLLASLIRHQSIRTANAMAYDFFLALIPTLGLGGWAAALLVGSDSGLALRELFLDLTPTQISGLIGAHFDALAKLHLAPLAALAGWWISSSAFNTMIGVFEETFTCQPRHWVYSRLIALGFALLGLLLMGLGSSFYVWVFMFAGPWGDWIHGLRHTAFLNWLFVIPGLGVIMGFLALVYRYSIRRPGRKRRVLVGATVATLLGATASLGLGYYATHIARYALFYGGLAAIVVVLLWLWLWSTAILIGAEVNIALEDVSEARRSRS